MKEKIIDKKTTGSYYTCPDIANFMVDWLIEDGSESVLEPSFGRGDFLDALQNKFFSMNICNPKITGVELQRIPYYEYTQKNEKIKCVLSDFMLFDQKEKFSAIIGNPPYVSLKKMDMESRGNVEKAMSRYNIRLSKSCSMWMPFIIHSTELLSNDGKLAFVLPYEITYVRYAQPLWKYLKSRYGKITVVRVYLDFFPEVDVETIIFFAEGKGGKTETVSYDIYSTVNDLISGKPEKEIKINISEILSLSKPFEYSLVPKATLQMIEKFEKNKFLVPLKNECKFKIGYVCGNKNYFHPTDLTIKNFNISRKNLLPTLLNAKQINEDKLLGIDTLGCKENIFLFYPSVIDDNTKRYLEIGKQGKVDKGYKCSKRNPWYITPSLEIPDVILTVFGDIPRFLINSKNLYVSNSLLAGMVSKNSDAKNIICRWYNSLTLLMIELKIHSLGGGSLVLIPGETDKLEILRSIPSDVEDLIVEKFDECLKNKGLKDTYLLGDELVLKQIYNFSDIEIENLRNSVAILQGWRNNTNRRIKL